jgi:hypothetical protein
VIENGISGAVGPGTSLLTSQTHGGGPRKQRHLTVGRHLLMKRSRYAMLDHILAGISLPLPPRPDPSGARDVPHNQMGQIVIADQ